MIYSVHIRVFMLNRLKIFLKQMEADSNREIEPEKEPSSKLLFGLLRVKSLLLPHFHPLI